MFSIDAGSVWKHLKTGHIYIIIGNCILEATNTDGILYRRCDGVYGPVWCRPREEFSDGRFIEINKGAE